MAAFEYVVEMTKGPSRYDAAALSTDRTAWASGYFSLCGENDHKHLVRNLINVDQNSR